MHIINQHLPFKLNSAFYYFFDKSVWVLFRNGTVSSFLRLFHLLLSFPWQSDGENEAREQRRKKWGTVVTSHWIRILWPNKDQQTETELRFSEEGSCPFTSCSYTMSLSVKESKTKICPLNHIPRVIFNLP